MLKIAVIGGGSTYTPELVRGFLERLSDLPVSELWLMDIDAVRLQTVGEFAQRMVNAAGQPFSVHLTDNRRAAIRDANYVITQLRVGHNAARREDEYLGRRHGLIGQETTGVGGMAKALRTIPVILEIASEMRELAPEALLVNFTNPSGLVTEALNHYGSGIKSIGVCNSAFTTKMEILKKLSAQDGVDYVAGQAEIITLGLNHLTWYFGFKLNGEDVWPRVFAAYLDELRSMAVPDFDPDFIARLGMIPNYYLEYFYNKQRKLDQQQNWPPSRAEEVLVIEEELLAYYRDLHNDQVPESLMKRGGAYYSTVATQLINAHFNDLHETHIVNVNHNGMIKGWERDWVLELACRIDRTGAHPLPIDPLPLYNYVLLEQVKSYELLTIEAAVHGDYQAAFRALVNHPLGPEDDQVDAVLQDLLQTNRPYLPTFFQ